MYVGHTNPDGREQKLTDHLSGVAQLCAVYAESFGAQDMAFALGMGHDIGKYSVEAQNRMLRNAPKVDHSTAGGQEINKLCGKMGAYCIMGHHGGLPNGGSDADAVDEPTLCGRLKRKPGKEIPDYAAFASEVRIAPFAAPPIRPMCESGFSIAMLIYMLHSCLVDADYLDTEEFMQNGRVQRGQFDDVPCLLDKLTKHLARFSAPKEAINQRRNEVLRDCIEAASCAKGLFSLTVPTGGGKTLASLAFALHHAKKHGMARVIYVIPYTSIIEQNAKVFADILGKDNVVEHHANIDYSSNDDELNNHELAAENWDAPVIVTTNVQFFESIFASKTSKSRKIHNIANSVVIFDEAQMLPAPFLLPCVRAIAEFVHNYGASAVLCTATQPALDAYFPKEMQVREICRDPLALQGYFKRVNICNIGKLTDDALSQQLLEAQQVLCIVNTRKQAQTIYSLLGDTGSYHLSTLMYPAHRKQVLEEIRQRLRDKKPCRVVATSLIEAGVDIDFPVVYRAVAGLDSVIQAAGRCNREGKRDTEKSITYVFEPEEKYTLPATMKLPGEVGRMVMRNHADIASLAAIQEYFSLLYGIKADSLDRQNIVKRLENGYKNGGNFPFRTIGGECKLIEDNTHSILIPIQAQAHEYAQRLRVGERTRALFRVMGQFCVNVYSRDFQNLDDLGVIERLDEHVTILADLSSYSEKTGLATDPEVGKGILV